MEPRVGRRRYFLARADGAVRGRRLRDSDARLLRGRATGSRHAFSCCRDRRRECRHRPRLPTAQGSLCGAADAGHRAGALSAHRQRHGLLHHSAIGLHAAVRWRPRHLPLRRPGLPRAARRNGTSRTTTSGSALLASGDRLLDRHHPRAAGPRLPGAARQSGLRHVARGQPLQVSALGLRRLGLLHRASASSALGLLFSFLFVGCSSRSERAFRRARGLSGARPASACSVAPYRCGCLIRPCRTASSVG